MTPPAGNLLSHYSTVHAPHPGALGYFLCLAGSKTQPPISHPTDRPVTCRACQRVLARPPELPSADVERLAAAVITAAAEMLETALPPGMDPEAARHQLARWLMDLPTTAWHPRLPPRREV